MKVLVTGANGQLGQSIQSIAHEFPDLDFIFCDSKQLDITNIENCYSIFEKHQPHVCINTAAYTAVDKAETEPEKAYFVNVIGVENLAIACKQQQTTLFHISTDFVFNGSSTRPYLETDTTAPIGVYGKTKREGEKQIEALLTNYYIIRTSWVYSQFGHNFMKTMLRLATEKEVISVVHDQIGTPTNAVDLAKCICKMITTDYKKPFGIYNFSNTGICSWFDFATEIFKQKKIECKVYPIPTTAFPTPAKRPAYSVLDKSKIQRTFSIEILDWKESLSNALKRI